MAWGAEAGATASFVLLKNSIFFYVDQILLCSDGVSCVLSDTQILECVQKCKEEAKSVCSCLVEEAIQCGSSDNLTAIYLYIKED